MQKDGWSGSVEGQQGLLEGSMFAQVFADLSFIKDVANDMEYESVFSEHLKRWGRKGDRLVVVGTSGRAPNVQNAGAVASALGMTVVTLSAMTGDSPPRLAGPLNAYIPAGSGEFAETRHAAILHYWMDNQKESRSG